MNGKFLRLFTALLFLSLVFAAAASSARAAEREMIEVTDQLSRKVSVPADVKRIVALHHHTLDILIELGQSGKLVGVVDRWKGLIGDYIEDICPKLATLPTPGGLTEINVEAVAALEPDVVFFAHQLPEEYIKKLEALGIPAIGISLYTADREQASTLSPKLVNPDGAYTDGMEYALRLIGKITGADERAGQLWDFIVKNRAVAEERLKNIKSEGKVRVYMTNPDMYTYGTGRYVGVALNRAGARNVAEELGGYVQVSVEQITAWNPEAIFVQSRYGKLLDEIKSDPAWKEIDAVKNGRLILTPEYVKPWGHPCPESMAIGELWLAKTFYPEIFKDVDVDAIVKEFYRTFYGVEYSG
jgi:iron complex transport system substrate-binding protein